MSKAERKTLPAIREQGAAVRVRCKRCGRSMVISPREWPYWERSEDGQTREWLCGEICMRLPWHWQESAYAQILRERLERSQRRGGEATSLKRRRRGSER